MPTVLEITELPGTVPVRMVKGASLQFSIQLAAGQDLPLTQVSVAIYENTPAGFAGTPALVPTLAKTGTGNYSVTVSSVQSNTLSIQKSYRWYFLRTISPTNTRHLAAGPWKVVAP
jgi:hypothetical protein